MFLFELIFFCFVYKRSHPINAFIVEIIANGALSQIPLTFLSWHKKVSKKRQDCVRFARKMGVRWLKPSKLAHSSLKQRRFFNANFTDFSVHRTRSLFNLILILFATFIMRNLTPKYKPYSLIKINVENLEILFLTRRCLEATPNGGKETNKRKNVLLNSFWAAKKLLTSTHFKGFFVTAT